MPLIDSPYDDRIGRLRERMQQKKGPNPNLRDKLQKFRAKQYFHQQRHRPPTPLPYSSAYETTVGGLTKTRDQTLADIAGRRLTTEQQFGFGADQSNPFSRATLLQRSYDQQQARTGNQYARMGQLYAGSLSTARAEDRFQQERSLDEVLREYQAELGGLSQEELAAGRGFEEGMTLAEAKRLEYAMSPEQRATPEEAPETPGYAKKYVRGLSKRAKKLAAKDKNKRGKDDRRAEKLRERISRYRMEDRL